MVVVVVRVGLVKQGYRRDVVSGGRHCWAHKICEGKRKVPAGLCRPGLISSTVISRLYVYSLRVSRHLRVLITKYIRIVSQIVI